MFKEQCIEQNNERVELKKLKPIFDIQYLHLYTPSQICVLTVYVSTLCLSEAQ